MIVCVGVCVWECVRTCVGWSDWHGWRAADSSVIKCIAVQCCSWALQRLKSVYSCRHDTEEEIHPTPNTFLLLFYPLKMTFFFHWKPMAECQPLHIFTIQRQFRWTSFSRCCQFFTFLSFYSLCLHGSLRVCGACRREGQSGRRRARRGLASQLHDMGDLQLPNPVILTCCCDPSPL